MAERIAVSRRSPDIAFQGGVSHKITHFLGNHWKLAASGVAAVGVLSMPPSQFINKIDALGAAMGIGSISCVEGVQPAHPGYSADEIVLLGSGNRRDRKLR